MASLLNVGRALVKLPYDAEIEYLESTGTQYIDTGVNMDSSVGAEVKYFPTTIEIYDKTDTHNILGIGDDRFRWGFTIYTSGNNLYLQTAGLCVKGVSWENVSCRSDISHTILYNYNNNKNVVFDSETVRTGLPYGNVGSGNIYMFTFNYGGNGGNYTGRNTPWRSIKAKIFYCKMTQQDVLIRDFIPVRIGNVGYMYDKVSGQLFGNSGTGDFILGPDKTN